MYVCACIRMMYLFIRCMYACMYVVADDDNDRNGYDVDNNTDNDDFALFGNSNPHRLRSPWQRMRKIAELQ